MNVTVVGVGYVGLVTGACLAEVGNSVCCVDSDLQKIEQLHRGIIPIYEPGLGALVNRGTESERLFFTNDLTDGISFADVIIIAVGTPQSTDGSADLQHVLEVARSIGDGIEGGESLTMGLEYIKKDKNQNEKLSIDLAQVIRSESNPDLPTSSTLNNKYSDIIGKVKFNLINNLNFEYNFMMDNNFDRTNYNSVLADISVNNFVTTFEYLEESALVGNKGFISNNTSYSFDENNSLIFSTRRNREIDLTEFYNLVYQYENDCLKAALEYNKTFYSDGDIEPEEQLFFSLTIVPFTKINTTNLK